MKTALPLLDREFGRLWIANLLSLTGSQVSRIGLILGIFAATDSVGVLALLIALETLPGVVCAPFAGAAVDRLDKRSVMIGADLIRMCALAVILLSPTAPVICAMAAAQSAATAAFHPARAAALPLVVAPSRLVAANAWDQAAANIMFIVGPVLGTNLFLAVGLRWTLVLDALTFAASAALIAGVRAEARPAQGRSDVLAFALGDIRDGWSYVRSHQLVLQLSALVFVSLLCAGLWTPLAPFFIRDYLGGTSRVLGWQFAAFGAGAVAGSALAPPLVRRFGRGVMVCAGFLAESACQTGYALAGDVTVSTSLVLLWGVAVSLVIVPFYSILQSVVAAGFRGRVFSAVRQSENVAMAAALGVAASLQGVLESRTILLAGGLAYSVLAASSCLTRAGRGLLATR